MPVQEKSRLINLFFLLMIVGAIIVIVVTQTNLHWQNTQEIIAALIIIIVFFAVVYIIRRNLLTSSDDGLAGSYIPKNNYDDSSNAEYVESQSYAPKTEYDFDTVLGAIEGSFSPDATKNEEESENQLIQFLRSRFPNKMLSKGHTSTGEKVDIVIDGTYSIYLAVINNEGRLVSLMDQILKSKRDFGAVAVILLDMEGVPTYTIEKYVDSYEKTGVRVIVKKCRVEDDGKENSY